MMGVFRILVREIDTYSLNSENPSGFITQGRSWAEAIEIVEGNGEIIMQWYLQGTLEAKHKFFNEYVEGSFTNPDEFQLLLTFDSEGYHIDTELNQKAQETLSQERISAV